MRRVTMAAVLVLGIAGLILSLGSPGSAATPATYTNYHQSGSLKCSDCHSMHLSLAHDYGGTTGGATYINLSGGSRLLKLTTGQVVKSQMCLNCHGGSTVAPDVSGSNTNTYVRSAGGVNLHASVGSNDSGYDTYMGHTIGSSSSAPGGTGSFSPGTGGLSCMDCHAQHGSTNFRNLNTTINSTSVTLSAMVGSHATGSAPNADVVVDVGGVATRTAWSTAGDFYKGANVWYYTNSANNYANLCAACHTGFAQTASGNGKHPTGRTLGGAGTAESQYTANYGTYGRVPVLAPSYSATSPYTPATGFQPTCVSCHKAHGNKNSFGLLMFGATTAVGSVTEEGETSQTATTYTCQQCHTQGS